MAVAALAVEGNAAVCGTPLKAVCPSASTAASSGSEPQSGSIWFGSSIDPATLALGGRASTFPRGTSIDYVTHLNRKSIGETLGLLILGSGSSGRAGWTRSRPARTSSTTSSPRSI